jgi:hypothetical protein
VYIVHSAPITKRSEGAGRVTCNGPGSLHDIAAAESRQHLHVGRCHKSALKMVEPGAPLFIWDPKGEWYDQETTTVHAIIKN